ncbi:glycosyltransferase [Gammaproteobacteria bacterium]|nr:glycosyltransferase [Gammaproteobacteria bacterium]
MKVCFVITSFSFFISHRHELLKELALKHNIFLVTDLSGVSTASIQEIEDQNIQLIHLPKRKKLTFKYFFKYLNGLKDAIQNIGPDCVFLVTLELTIYGAIISRLYNSKCKWNFIISGIGPFYNTPNLRYKLFKSILAINIKFVIDKNKSMFIFQNPDNLQLFIQNGLIKKINSTIIFGNGINILENNLVDYNTVQPRFCFVGRLAKSKGIVEFITASKMINQTYPDIEFLVAGEYHIGAEDYCSVEFYNSIKKLSHIKFHSHLDHSQVSKIYKNGDVFVLPSYGEGLPKAALEAASLSLPLILSDVPGCRECIDNNGILVEYKNPESLKQAMEVFINKPQLINTLGKKSLDICNRKFSIEKIVNDFNKLILR